MKIALVSDDGRTISRHFGRAEKYVVVSLDQQEVTGKTSFPKLDFCHSSHGHHGRHGQQEQAGGSGFGRHARLSHEQLFANIRDCDVLVSGGMGRGAYLDLQSLGIRPIVTDMTDIDAAVQAVVDDTIVDHVDKLH